MNQNLVQADINTKPSKFHCKNICIDYEYHGNKSGPVKYSDGVKRCRAYCDRWLIVSADTFRCPCCGFMLRSKPRLARLREKYITKKRY